MNTILAVYRNSRNFLYSHFYILSIIVPIWAIYTFSIKSHYSYLNIFSILLPITAFYRLTIVSLYRHLYTKYIWVTDNIIYKGSLDFGIPGVSPWWPHSQPILQINDKKEEKTYFCSLLYYMLPSIHTQSRMINILQR